MKKLDELTEDLAEMTELRDKLLTEREQLRGTVNELVEQLRDTLRNKALLEGVLRGRIAGVEIHETEITRKR